MPRATLSASPATRIRLARASDLSAVEQIEREQFANPWSREYFAAELANRFSHFYIAEAGPESGCSPPGQVPGCREAVLVGFLLFWRLGGELELHKIAVGGAWQRRGHAARLLEFFVQTGRSWGSERAVLEVRASNVAAIRLYEKFAFRPVGRRRDYYTLPVEDALVYEFVFSGTETDL
jgi:ribosomal-protein-alanine N-acetyltransferase